MLFLSSALFFHKKKEEEEEEEGRLFQIAFFSLFLLLHSSMKLIPRSLL